MMNRKNRMIGILLCCAAAASAQPLQWPKASPEARPSSRWWWFGSAVDGKNLTYNLEEYARVGWGALEITPIYGVQGNEKNEIPFLSSRWADMLKHTLNEARRVGLEIDMNTGTGWPFGGPEVDIRDAAACALFLSYELEGGKSVGLNIGVTDEKQRPYAQLSRVMAYGENGRVLNLTEHAHDGRLDWQAPVGRWRLVVLYNGKTLQKVKRAAPGGEGYVLDHFSKRAVAAYLNRFDRAFGESGSPRPRAFFADSYEVFQADWTEDLLREFVRRRGYRLEDHFPEFLDGNRTETGRRLVSDYRETLSELLLENFTRQWTSWAHRSGSLTRSQAHGSPANLIDLYAEVDIPECEGFGLSQFHIEGLRTDSLTRKNDSDLSMLKYASSAAHVAGKPFTSSETFTWLTEHFRTSLSQCKPDLDLMFVSGVNRVGFHGTPYSPQEAEWPGWLFYASVNMSPSGGIWREMPSFSTYITRCQSFLQMGRPDNDFLIYLPVYDMWHEQDGRLLLFTIHEMEKLAPKFMDAVHRILRSGYDGDYISDRYLRSTRWSGGRLVTAGGTAYKALVIPSARLMPPDVLEHLCALAAQGATVVFLENYPSDVPGYGNLSRRRADYRKAMNRLPRVSFAETTVTPVGKGRIVTGSDYVRTLAACGIRHEEMKTAFGLQAVRRANDKGHHYFISALRPGKVDGWVTLGVPAEWAALFDPMTGSCGSAKFRKTDEGFAQVYLQLQSGESVVLQTFDRPLTGVAEWPYVREQSVSLCVDEGWTLRFVESRPEIEGSFDIGRPRSWTTIAHPSAAINSGTAIYAVEFDMPEWKADDWMLDAGDVRESARVRVNGQDAGCMWAVPYRLRVGHLLKPGKNSIEIEVTNLPANRIAELDRQGVKWRKFKEINMVGLDYRPSHYGHWEPLPSGLNGAVRLIPLDKLFPERTNPERTNGISVFGHRIPRS